MDSRQNKQARGKADRERLLKSYMRIFNLDDFIAQEKFFEDYVKNYGSSPPVKTSWQPVNHWLNYALSFTHFIPTNQERAKKCLDLIEEAIGSAKKNEKSAAVYIVDALQKIKTVHNELIKNHIAGTVRTHIEETFKKFGLPIEETLFNTKIEEITHIIKYSETLGRVVKTFN